MPFKQFSLVDLLVFQAGCLISFFLHPYLGLTGIWLLCFAGVVFGTGDVFSWLERNGSQDISPLALNLGYRAVGALMGGTVGGVVGIALVVAFYLVDLISSGWDGIHAIRMSCLLTATVGGSFMAVSRRLTMLAKFFSDSTTCGLTNRRR